MKTKLLKSGWRTNQVIRHIDTGHLYLVLHTSNFYTGVVDLMVSDPLSQMLTLLPRHYDEYSLDERVKLKKNEREELEGTREVYQLRQCLSF
jgi:hypothetical protein